MIEIYLVITLLANGPKVAVYQDIQQACLDFDAQAAQQGVTPHIYKETAEKRSAPTIVEGDCRPLKQFVTAAGGK